MFSAGKAAPGLQADNEAAVDSVRLRRFPGERSGALSCLLRPRGCPPPCPPSGLSAPSISLHTNTWASLSTIHQHLEQRLRPSSRPLATGRGWEGLGGAGGWRRGPLWAPQEPSGQGVMEQHCPRSSDPTVQKTRRLEIKGYNENVNEKLPSAGLTGED